MKITTFLQLSKEKWFDMGDGYETTSQQKRVGYKIANSILIYFIYFVSENVILCSHSNWGLRFITTNRLLFRRNCSVNSSQTTSITTKLFFLSVLSSSFGKSFFFCKITALHYALTHEWAFCIALCEVKLWIIQRIKFMMFTLDLMISYTETR